MAKVSETTTNEEGRIPISAVPTMVTVKSDPGIVSTSSSTVYTTSAAVRGKMMTKTISKFITGTMVTSTPAPAVGSSDSDIATVQSSSTTWSCPRHFTSLDVFKITKFACGKQNVGIVDVADNVSSASRNDPSVGASASPSSSSTSVLQLSYPQGSMNPGHAGAPQGGADFYASPLDISNRRNVTLAYSVFFPAGFSFVKGGKLPGLYGGRPGCSGGDAALDCFSTRLMWRPNGAGELYLYAPKTKQAAGVCSTPPFSSCDADYGLSIDFEYHQGRGSFKFARGEWTNVRQTVYLNTPGKQDGIFTLDVNGIRAMFVKGVYYRQASTPKAKRHDLSLSLSRRSSAALTTGPKHNLVLESLASPWNADSGEDQVAMVEAFDQFLGSLEADAAAIVDPFSQEDGQERQESFKAGLEEPLTDDFPEELFGMQNVTSTPGDATTNPIRKPFSSPPDMEQAVWSGGTGAEKTGVQTAESDNGVGFAGIFFSTFFGGHDETWASPMDQRTWFRDFTLEINDPW
ncbi:hypothetical protein FRB99_008079 [Tulasnella sp. 403]|nr:hypothetical protein FRB99_008079 [Tulasnella sp. 403]